MSNAYDAGTGPAGMSPDAGPPEAGDSGLAGPPQGGAGLLAALRQQQQGPSPSAPGPGNQANAMTLMQNVQLMLERALPNLRGHPLYQDITRFLQRLGRHAAQSPGTAGIQQTSMGDFMRDMARHAMLAQLQGRQGQGGGPQQQPQPPNPSMPLPGA